jgi:hypothetical protein
MVDRLALGLRIEPSEIDRANRNLTTGGWLRALDAP